MKSTAPRTAVEWADWCIAQGHGFVVSVHPHWKWKALCTTCADAYARQQVETFRERAANLVEAYEQEVVKKVSIRELEDILSRQDQPSIQLLSSGEVSIKEKPLTLHALAAAIRALEPSTSP